MMQILRSTVIHFFRHIHVDLKIGRGNIWCQINESRKYLVSNKWDGKIPKFSRWIQNIFGVK